MIFYVRSIDCRVIIFSKRFQSCYSSLIDNGELEIGRLVPDMMVRPSNFSLTNCSDYVINDNKLVIDPITLDATFLLLRARCLALRRLDRSISLIRQPLKNTLPLQSSIYAMKKLEAAQYLESPEGTFSLLKGSAAAHGITMEQEALKILSHAASLETTLIDTENARITLQAMIMKALDVATLLSMSDSLTVNAIKKFDVVKPPVL